MNKLNLGRVKGEKGDTGPQGPPVDILQTTGSSTESTMSQAAVTRQLDSINIMLGDVATALDAINGEAV